MKIKTRHNSWVRVLKIEGHDVTRQVLDTRIKSLKGELRRNLVRLQRFLKQGQDDKAYIMCSRIARQRSDMLKLARRYEVLCLNDAVDSERVKQSDLRKQATR